MKEVGFKYHPTEKSIRAHLQWRSETEKSWHLQLTLDERMLRVNGSYSDFSQNQCE